MKKVIRFTAAWCGPCRMYSKTFNEVEKKFVAIDFETVDVDTENPLIMEYGIRNVPTTVVVNADGTNNKHAGIMSEDQLIKFINQ